jgi:hypothetical protein
MTRLSMTSRFEELSNELLWIQVKEVFAALIHVAKKQNHPYELFEDTLKKFDSYSLEKKMLFAERLSEIKWKEKI